MKNNRYKFIFIVLTICTLVTTSQLHAQTPGTGKITGKAIDVQTNETIPFASVLILDRKSKTTVKTGQTDVNGNLVIAGIPDGVFSVKISYVGYQSLTRDSISINKTHQLIALGTIKMKTSKGNALNEVNVTAKKAPIQLGIDKKVFAVDQSLVSQGGDASDLLSNVPSVSVDQDGNVSLRGSTGVKVLIDGKPSLIAGGDIASILASIPASSIESVEVITNPSSKYDSEGDSGIINIILKKNSIRGFNGNVSGSAGNRDNYNGTAALSYQNKNINVYGNYSYRYGRRVGGGYNNITYLHPVNDLSYADQLTNSIDIDKSHNFKAGIDYTLTKKDVISFSGGFNIRDNKRNDQLNINEYAAGRVPLEFDDRTNDNNGSGNSHDFNLDYSHKFKKDQELTFNFGYSGGTNNNFQQYNTNIVSMNGVPYNDTDPLMQTNANDGKNTNYNIQADYNMPLGKLGKLETGYRSQIRLSNSNIVAENFDNTTGAYAQDFELSNRFKSNDQVHALYFNYSNQIKNFGYQIGLRGEDAKLNTTSTAFANDGSSTPEPGRVAYNRLYPSIFLTQKFKGDQSLQFSYTRRVNRPRPWDTNPYTDISDPLTWRRGNPNLLPEDVHSYELSYSKFWPKVTLIASAYVRQTNDLIQRIRSTPDSAGVIIIVPENLGKSTNSGFELISKVDILKVWNFTANINGYHSSIGSINAGTVEGVSFEALPSVSGYSWNANLTNNFTLPHNITLQLRGDYQSSQVQSQGTRKAMYGVDGGAKYDFPGKKASLSFNVRNIFDTRKFGATIQDSNSITDFQRYQKGPMGTLTFAYRFGNTSFAKKPKKQDQEAKPDEGGSF